MAAKHGGMCLTFKEIIYTGTKQTTVVHCFHEVLSNLNALPNSKTTEQGGIRSTKSQIKIPAVEVLEGSINPSNKPFP